MVGQNHLFTIVKVRERYIKLIIWRNGIMVKKYGEMGIDEREMRNRTHLQ